MIAATRPQRGINGQGYQVELGKRHDKTLCPVAMSPTKSEDDAISEVEAYGLKWSITYLAHKKAEGFSIKSFEPC
jgi:hypothetical protein